MSVSARLSRLVQTVTLVQGVLRVLSLPTSRHHLAGLASINNKKKTTKWKQQLTMALGPDNVLGVGEIVATRNA
ncbi:hypothetical protein VNO78_24384 [Psophocarpus tetragonolobus]|uniref:Uncharacterized protein n=1 Tax=Psophocarpus tetragonolobus TaxID=3891 RepID=A0AAN9S5G9_PSOTE